MEYPNSEPSDAASAADAAARNTANARDTDSMWWSTAIERQIAAKSTLGRDKKMQEETLGPAIDPDRARFQVEPRAPYRFGWGSYLLLFLLIAAGAAFIYIGFINPDGGVATARRLTAALQTWVPHNSTSAANDSHTNTSAHALNSTPTPNSAPALHAAATINNHVQAGDAAAINSSSSSNANVAPTVISASTTTSASSSAQIAESKKMTEAAAPDAISLPIAEVSLRNRPELLEQLVQIYRVQLANHPNDLAALKALSQLQERSLSELETIIAQGDDSVTIKALAALSRIFPELSDNTHYKYLIARMDFAHREKKSDAVARAEPAAPSPSSTTPANSAANIQAAATSLPVPNSSAAKDSASAKAAVPTKNNSSPKTAAADSTANAEKKSAAEAASTKPEIRSVSITPGTMVNDRFVPSDGGNVFMIELSYSNFAKAFVDQNEATLVTRLGVPGDPMVLAEAPVTISADRGTKNFLIETTSLQGYVGGKFKLNFMLNDEFLTSRTVSLSLRGQ